MAIDIFCYVSYNVFVCVFGKCLKWIEKNMEEYHHAKVFC